MSRRRTTLAILAAASLFLLAALWLLYPNNRLSTAEQAFVGTWHHHFPADANTPYARVRVLVVRSDRTFELYEGATGHVTGGLTPVRWRMEDGHLVEEAEPRWYARVLRGTAPSLAQWAGIATPQPLIHTPVESMTAEELILRNRDGATFVLKRGPGY
jgi:hypothetical protein